MFKKIALVATLALLASSSFAATPYYAGVDLGQTKIDNISGRKTSYGAFAGYQFNPSVAIEAGVRRLASFTESNVDFTYNQLALSVVGTLPVGNGFSLLGRLGYNRLTAKASSNNFSMSDHDNGSLLGVGAAYTFAPNITGRLEFQRPASDTNNVSVGVSFGF